jgi:glycosyltransferase involved in cell wall biosynthesis
MTERCVALLGRADAPTDAVEDYCRYLGDALEKHGVLLDLVRVPWAERGWNEAFREVHEKAHEKKGCWFLVQYTALAWSRRGFPLRLPELMRVLKQPGARCAVVFHDASPYAGSRMIDRARRMAQVYAMRKVLRMADLAILTYPPEKASWIPSGSRNTVFIPVGANLPCPERVWGAKKNKADGARAVCVFSVSPGPAGRAEVEWIAQAVGQAAQKIKGLQLVIAGRNSIEAGRELQKRLNGASVEVIAHGLLAADEIVQVLGACHVMLFARGQISSRRGSAIAGIACGLPVVACRGSETAPPITEAGVVLLPAEDKDGFGPALVRVLTDDAYRESLAGESRNAQQRYFSWTAIAGLYVESLHKVAVKTQG